MATPNPRSTGIQFSKVYKNAADRIESAASIASGHGEYGLANQLWAFEGKLRKKARAERELEALRTRRVLERLNGEGDEQPDREVPTHTD